MTWRWADGFWLKHVMPVNLIQEKKCCVNSKWTSLYSISRNGIPLTKVTSVFAWEVPSEFKSVCWCALCRLWFDYTVFYFAITLMWVVTGFIITFTWQIQNQQIKGINYIFCNLFTFKRSSDCSHITTSQLHTTCLCTRSNILWHLIERIICNIGTACICNQKLSRLSWENIKSINVRTAVLQDLKLQNVISVEMCCIIMNLQHNI